MRLDAWLKQPHTPVERLRLVERLAQALNGVHDRGETAGSIAPERVELGADLKVDFSPAARGRPEPGYAAPEQLEGGPPTPASDVYSVGALCWEVLVGRPCGEAPRPLADVAPELPRELANSVMGCLERGAEWRPKDLTYLAQLAAAQQKVSQPQQPAAKPAAKPGPKPERAAAPPRQPAPQRPATRRPSRSLLPLVVAAVLLVAAAASSYLWMQRQGEPRPAATPAPPPAPVAAATPDPVATAAPVRAAAPAPAPSTAPSAAPAAQPTPAATPVPEPTPVEIAAPAPTPTPAPTPLATPTPAASAPAATRAEPAALSTLSPLSVKRPGRVLLDIRGTGLRPDLRVLVTPQKGAARGIAIVRLKWTSASLLNVLIELDASVAPGAYAVALEDAAGNRTNPLLLTITK